MRLTTPRSSRQHARHAIDDRYPGDRTRRHAARFSKLSRSDLVRWPNSAVRGAATSWELLGDKQTSRGYPENNAIGRVEERRGSLGHSATLRFLSPLIEPDKQISRIRLSDKTSRRYSCVRRHLQFLNTQRS